MYTKVVGVTHSNDDGSSRQKILKRMKETAQKGDRIELRREPDNPHDKNAIAVYNKDGEQLGYVNRETAKEFAAYMDENDDITADLDKIIGGEGLHSYGCIIDLAIRGIKAPGGQVWDPNSKKSDRTRLPWGRIAIGLFLFYLTQHGSPFGGIGLVIFVGHCLVRRFRPDKISLYWKCIAGVILLLVAIGMILQKLN